MFLDVDTQTRLNYANMFIKYVYFFSHCQEDIDVINFRRTLIDLEKSKHFSQV